MKVNIIFEHGNSDHTTMENYELSETKLAELKEFFKLRSICFEDGNETLIINSEKVNVVLIKRM